MMKQLIYVLLVFALLVQTASAHCDHVQGPVIKAADKAIAQNDVNHILIWIHPSDESKVIQLFNSARPRILEGNESVRIEFYEDIVKIHRMGEGASFQGIKYEEQMAPIIVAADAAIETANIAVLHPYVSDNQERHDRIVAAYREVMIAKNYNPSDLEAGREYVKKYIEFMDMLEEIEEEKTLEDKTQKSPRTGLVIVGGVLLASIAILGVSIGVKRR